MGISLTPQHFIDRTRLCFQISCTVSNSSKYLPGFDNQHSSIVDVWLIMSILAKTTVVPKPQVQMIVIGLVIVKV